MNQVRNNPRNDRAKREYLIYLKDARQRSASTVEQVRHAIDRFEQYTGFKDFGTFNKEQARAFKKSLAQSKGQRSGKPISTATAHHILQAVKEFLAWLHSRPGYRRRIDTADIAYLNLTTNEERAAHATRPKAYATLEQYRAALFAMPTVNEVDRREQAVMALLLLTGMRDAAAVSLKLKHISVEPGHVYQDPREVDTKFRKAINTWFFPVGDDIANIVRDWVHYLTTKKLFGPNDPVFPKALVRPDAQLNFAVQGLSKEHCANAAPVRRIFREAFARVGLPYVRPHSVRDTLTQLAYKMKLDLEELKAWSVNMGHESVLTTLGSYGHISPERQEEVMSALGRTERKNWTDQLTTEIAAKVTAMMSNRGGQP